MAESLGEAFVEVLADTSPFGDSLTEGISEALDGIEADVSGALDGVGPAAEEAFGQISEEARGSADETTEAFDDVADDVNTALGGITFDAVADGIRDNIGKITLAAAGAAAGAEGFARSQQDLSFATATLSTQTGLTESEVRDLATSLSDATFPLDDVLELLEIGAQRGLEGADSLANYASFWDMVGDATGENGVALGKAGVALAAIGIELGNETEALDAFGFIANETTQDVGDFLTFIERTGPQLRDLGLDVNQTAGLLQAMERELGMSGRMARTEFRKAVSAADGDLGEMLKTLGLSEDQFSEYADAVEGSSSVIIDNAAAFADTRTPMQNIQSELADLAFRFPQVSEAAGLLAAPLAAVGPAALGITQGVKAASLAKAGLTKTIAGLSKGLLFLAKTILMNPIFLIGAVLIGLAILVFKFREEIVEFLVGAFEMISERASEFFDFLKGAFSAGVDALVGFFTNLRDSAIEIVQRIFDVYKRIWGAIFNTVRNIVSRVRDFVARALEAARDRAVSAVQRLFDRAKEIFGNLLGFVRELPGRILSALGNMGNLLRGAGRAIMDGLLGGITKGFDAVRGFVGGIGDTIRSLKGPMSEDKVMLEDIGEAIIGGLGRGMQTQFEDVQQMLGGFNTSIPLSFDRSAIGDVGAAAGVTVGGRGGGQNIELTVNNPEPEAASTSLNRELRKLSAIGVFGGD